MTREELQARRRALQEALFSGELSIRDADGKSITYRSVKEIREAMTALDGELEAVVGRRRVPRMFRSSVTKGV